jgi:hypothetical protein
VADELRLYARTVVDDVELLRLIDQTIDALASVRPARSNPLPRRPLPKLILRRRQTALRWIWLGGDLTTLRAVVVASLSQAGEQNRVSGKC